MKFPHMLLKIKVPAEPLTTNLAREGLLVIVRMHVERQIVDLMKRLVTNVALVGLLPTVGQLMVFVITLLMKTLPTKLTHKWFIVGVNPGVSIQGGASVEGFSTGLTFVWFFGSVDDLVPAEGARLTKSLSTNFADERPRPGVNWHVSREVVVSIEDLPTLGTCEGFLFGWVHFSGCWTLLPPVTLGRTRRDRKPG